jgi:hypothetical protein
MFKSKAESLVIVELEDMLAPIDAAASKEGNPNPLPKVTTLPGKKHGALNTDRDVKKSRSNDTAEVTVPI